MHRRYDDTSQWQVNRLHSSSSNKPFVTRLCSLKTLVNPTFECLYEDASQEEKKNGRELQDEITKTIIVFSYSHLSVNIPGWKPCSRTWLCNVSVTAGTCAGVPRPYRSTDTLRLWLTSLIKNDLHLSLSLVQPYEYAQGIFIFFNFASTYKYFSPEPQNQLFVLCSMKSHWKAS